MATELQSLKKEPEDQQSPRYSAERLLSNMTQADVVRNNLPRYSGTFFKWGWILVGWRSLSCLSTWRSLGLSSKYALKKKNLQHQKPVKYSNNEKNISWRKFCCRQLEKKLIPQGIVRYFFERVTSEKLKLFMLNLVDHLDWFWLVNYFIWTL